MRHRTPLVVAILLLIGLAIAGATGPRSTDPLDRAMSSIRPEPIRGHIQFLSDDLLEGRATGSRGHDVAARYVASQFEAIGLKGAGETGSWFQSVPFLRTHTVESECELTFVRGTAVKTLRYAEDYAMPGDYLHAHTSVEAPLVFAGFGVTAPELQYDDYAGVDVKGKVVVLLSGSPRTFPHNQRAYYSQGVQKEANAVARGARGIITVRTPVDEVRTTWERQIRQGRLPGMRWTDSGGVPHDSHPELEVGAALNRSGAEALFEGAPHSLQDVFANAETGRARSFELPTRVRARRATDHSRVVSPNVVAVLRGSDPKLRDEYVVYTCHLDHLGISTPVNGDSINNGAYDNASGTAIVIELARALKSLPTRPRRSILFLAVTGEEKGLQGSDYFAHFPTVPPEGIVADINLDMFLMLQPLDNITVFGAEHSSLGPVIERAAKRLGVGILPDSSPEEVIFVRSDQFSFVKQGVPALFPVAGGRTGGPGHEAVVAWLRSTYHSPQDDFSQKMDLTAGVRFTKINLLTGWWVANETARPRWNPGDFFGEKFGSARVGSNARPSP